MLLRRKKNPLKIIPWLLMVVMITALVPAFVTAESPHKIEKFERLSPVYTEVVNLGTQKDELNLPNTIRGIVSLKEYELDATSFVQAEPVADMSDGYAHYDYYYYGYVASKNVTDNYASGEEAIYSIFYAKQDASGEATDAVGEVGYRVYGSMNGTENTWFACDDAGVINGVVIDIPITWKDNGYDKDIAGEYTFTASFANYSYSGAKPFAAITVEGSSSESDASTLEHDEESHCICDLAKDEYSDAHAQECPYYLDNSCNCSYGKNESSDEHAEDCPWYVEAKVGCECGALEGEMHLEGCSLHVRSAEDCKCGPNNEAIDEDNFPWAHHEDCTHFSPVECMCREMIETRVENITDGIKSGEDMVSMIPGEFSHIHDNKNSDCPLFGKATVGIKKLTADAKSVMTKDDAEYIVAKQEKADAPYPALGKIEIIDGSEQSSKSRKAGVTPFSGNGGGANDIAQDNYMQANTPTSGNSSYSSQYTGGVTIPGVWKDYVNTIWMNKAYNQFAWTLPADTGAFNGWAYIGYAANQTADTVTTNPLKMPTKVGSTWTVYSGEQFRYALINMVSGDTVSLGGNLNMNGNEHTWNTYNEGRKNITITGNNFKIYNLGLTQTALTSDNTLVSCLIYNYLNLNVRDIEFVTAKFVTNQGYAGMFRGPAEAGTFSQVVSLSNMHIKDSMFYSSHGNSTISPFGMLSSHNNSTTIDSRTALNNCSSRGGYIYGADHVSSFVLGVGNYHTSSSTSSIANCFTVENLLCGTGGHSAGFTSCAGGKASVTDCFASNEVYGSTMTSGFVGFPSGTYTNCYSSGKVEGYMRLAGFGWDSGNPSTTLTLAKTYNNCYSTTLVGLRTSGMDQGGFAMMNGLGDGTFKITMNNCYSAGEVGNYDTNMDNPQNIGGFNSHTSEMSRYVFNNCYYDKQTSAMREWAAGNSKSIAGLTGVLTTTTSKGGNGLASGTYGATGFSGFANNSQWVYENEHYPQLSVFSNPNSGVWGTADRANLVKAYSLASTSTVMLDTWDSGYDWNDTGVRTANEISYDRTLASTGETSHKGYQYTYDTVREIISPFSVTSNGSYSHMVGNGAPSEQMDNNGATASLTNTVVIDDTAKTGITENPGMDWYRISAINNGQTGYRPIRLIGYMNVEAGNNQTLTCGQKYDHRPDVELAMMDTLTDNLVVGMDDSKIWSSSKKGKYPDSPKYYALETTNMETNFSASKNAWIYTEIWRAAQNLDGTFVQDTANQHGYVDGADMLVPDLSVKVTGTGTGSGTTLTEQKWNGEIPISTDSAGQRKYIISYYWMLTDGRYVRDYKVVTLEPNEYDLMIDVLTMQNGDKSDPKNSSSLYLGTGIDDSLGNLAYVLSSGTETHNETLGIGYSKNAAAAWKKINSNVTVVKTQVDLYANDDDRTLMGTATVNGSLVDGSTITIPTKYYYRAYEYDSVQGKDREVLSVETLDITYTIVEEKIGGVGTGEFYFRFNKLANAPANEMPAALIGSNDTTGIPGTANSYINDMQFNTEITLWVNGGTDFEFIKVDEDGNPFGAGDAEFQLYSCTHVHDTNCGGLIDPDKCNHYHKIDGGGAVIPGDNHYELATDISEANGCWAVSGSTVLTAITDADGKILFEELNSGDYILAETSTIPGYQLPMGQWMIQVDAPTGTINISSRGESPPAFMQDIAVLKLPNYPKLTIPHMGGTGPILFTAIGIVLVGAALILSVITKRKRSF